MDSQIFETETPTKLFFRCVIPSIISMAAGSLYQIVDGVFVGRFVGEGALAAVNLIMPLFSIIFAVSNMIATGASVRISLLLGLGKQKEASQIFTFVLKMIFWLSLAVGTAGFIFARPIVRLLSPGATREAIKYGITYIRIYSLFNPVMPIYFATDNFLRVCGREKTSMWINVVTQLINILLDTVLIVFLNQGLAAAAAASCVSMSLGAVTTLLLFKGGKLDLYYTHGHVAFRQVLKLIANGSSEFFSNIAMSVTSLVFNFYLLKYGKTTGVAAFSVVMYADSFVGMLIFGMCDSMQPPVSHCYGAGLISKVRAFLKRMMLAGIILSVISMLFMFFAGKYVAPFFVKSEDTELLRMSISAMKIFSFSYLVGWIDMVLSSFFTSLDRPARSLTLSLLGTLVFPIVSLVFLTNMWGLNGVWISPSVSGVLVSIAALIMLKTLKLDYLKQ